MRAAGAEAMSVRRLLERLERLVLWRYVLILLLDAADPDVELKLLNNGHRTYLALEITPYA